MSMPCDREGIFRAVIVEYGLKEMDSGAIAVSIKASLKDLWNNGDWAEWAQYEMEAEGDLWIVKKDSGGPNKSQIEALCRCAGWDGNLESIVAGTWQPTPCQVVVKRDEYKGNVRYKIAFVNAYDKTPGALSNVDDTKARELQTRYGAQIRAIAANVARNGTPTNGAPPPPPAAASKATAPAPPVSIADGGADIPF